MYRLADDRVMVEAWLTPKKSGTILGNFHEPGIRGTADEIIIGEFSDVVLTISGDETKYLPVRAEDEEKTCLCSHAWDNRTGASPIFVVMSAPKEATEVNLDIPGYDTFKNIPVEPQLPQRDLAPLAFGYQYRLLEITRPELGKMHIEYALEHPDVEWGYKYDSLPVRIDGRTDTGETYTRLQQLLSATSDGTSSGFSIKDKAEICQSCTDIGGTAPKAGYGIRLAADLTDPGTETISPFLYTGWMLSGVAPTGGTTGQVGDPVLEYKARWREEGIRSHGTELNLDTAVLFNFNKDTLTKKATKIIDKAITTLQAQEGRTLKITGHTDTTGTDSYNLDLSKRRANTVKNALAKQLGTGWTLTAEGKGETDPAISEKGLTGDDLKQAQATNRRVQITIQ